MMERETARTVLAPWHLGVPGVKGEPAGALAIAKVFGVKRQTVVDWRKSGAPIHIVGGRMQAEYSQLWDWLRRAK